MIKFFQISGILIVLSLLFFRCNGRDYHIENISQEEIPDEKAIYDSLKVVEYGADEYGMKISPPEIQRYSGQG
jgi:hypothetical protein